MSRAILLFALAAACASAPKPRAEADERAAPACASPETQRVLTYCVSPQAAQFAAQNEAALAAIGRGPVPTDLFPLPIDNSPTLGPDDAPVTIVIFSDFECPFCAKAHAELAELQRAMPADIRLVYKHLPLGSIHPDAEAAAVAAAAAQEQGKFWAYAEALFASEDLSERSLVEAARAAKLDLARWRSALAMPEVAERVRQDAALAKELHARSTPTIFFNGVPLPAAVSAAELAPLVEGQREIARAFVAAGVPPQEIYARMVRAQYRALPEPTEPEPEAGPAALYIPVGRAPVRGAAPDDALVTIIAFSDFECPFCARAAPALERLIERRGEAVRLVFKHMPLPSHERADEAAAASVIAQRAGEFWAFHDAAFAAGPGGLDDQALRAMLRSVGVLEPGDEPWEDEAAAARVESDMREAVEAGVRGTPTFFVNGVRYLGALPLEEWDTIVDEQIALARQVAASRGVRGEALYRALVEQNARDAEAGAP